MGWFIASHPPARTVVCVRMGGNPPPLTTTKDTKMHTHTRPRLPSEERAAASAALPLAAWVAEQQDPRLRAEVAATLLVARDAAQREAERMEHDLWVQRERVRELNGKLMELHGVVA